MQRPPPQRPTARPMPAVGRGAPKCCRSCLGRRPAKNPRGEDRAEALPMFTGPPKHRRSCLVRPEAESPRRPTARPMPTRGAEPPSVVGYGDGAPRGDDKATAFAARLARVMMAARRTGDVEAAAVALKTTPRRMTALPHDDESDDDAHQGARQRPPRATKAARRTGVDEAAFTSTMDDAEDDDVAPPATRTPTTAPTTMPTTTSRGAQSRGRPGRLTSTAQGA
jgi:hypothetical protein